MKKWAPLQHDGEVHAVVFSPDGKLFVSAATTPTNPIRVWEMATGKERAPLRDIKVLAKRLAIAPDSKLLAFTAGSDDIILWNLETAQMQQTLRLHKFGSTPIAFSPDGNTLAAGSNDDGTIILWDVRTQKTRATLNGHADCLAFSPYSATLASGSRDGTVRLWDVGTAKERMALRQKGFTIASTSRRS